MGRRAKADHWKVSSRKWKEVRKFTTKTNPLNESTVRRFNNLYKNEIQQALKEKRDVKNELKILP